MNIQQQKMLDILRELKEVHGVYAIKAEFEAEGARKDELIGLRELILKADLNFIIKIGGCEAVHDMDQCKLLGATGVIKAGENFLKTVTVGRSDLSASMGIARKDIETQPVFDATHQLLTMSREAGFTTNFGGNIGIESIPFIIRMSSIADRFETRKVVVRMNTDEQKLKKAIARALEFELMYLMNKSACYDAMAKEDAQRIIRMQNQIQSAK